MRKMYFVGDKVKKSLILNSGIYYSAPPAEELILENLKKNFPNVKDFNIFFTEDEKVQDRIMNGDAYDLVWSSENTIVGVDFTQEDSKKFIQFSVDKNDVLRDGTDGVNMIAEILKKDGKTVDSSFNDVLRIQVGVPYGKGYIYIKAQFTDGKMERLFQPEALGEYMYPFNKTRIGQFRVKNQILIDSDFGV